MYFEKPTVSFEGKRQWERKRERKREREGKRRRMVGGEREEKSDRKRLLVLQS